jgi:hypothetical protein
MPVDNEKAEADRRRQAKFRFYVQKKNEGWIKLSDGWLSPDQAKSAEGRRVQRWARMNAAKLERERAKAERARLYDHQ